MSPAPSRRGAFPRFVCDIALALGRRLAWPSSNIGRRASNFYYDHVVERQRDRRDDQVQEVQEIKFARGMRSRPNNGDFIFSRSAAAGL